MSNPAITWARGITGIEPAEKLVLLLLADQANKQAQAWPSVAKLQAEGCMGERTVQRALAGLAEKGLIKREGAGGRSLTRLYTLMIEATETVPDEAERVSGRHPLEPQERVPNPTERVPSATERVPNPTVKGANLTPEPSREPIEPKEPSIIERVPAVRIEGFEDWWKAYPRKVGKGAARTAYLAAVKRGASEQDLAAALRRQQWPAEERFIPHARTWLTQDRWQDEPGHAAPHAETLTDTIAGLMADPMGQGPPRAGSGRFEFEGTAEEIFRA